MPDIDGNWIDISSFCTAIVYAVIKAFRRSPQKWISRKTSIDLANGTSIFPLLVLGFSFLSSKLLAELLHANKLILSVAGLCALLAMLEDDF